MNLLLGGLLALGWGVSKTLTEAFFMHRRTLGGKKPELK